MYQNVIETPTLIVGHLVGPGCSKHRPDHSVDVSNEYDSKAWSCTL